jgi:hypothetical protein
MMRSVRPLAVLALLALLTPDRAFAQSDSDKTTARELGTAGEVKLASQDYKGAEDQFRRANALFHAPTLVLGLARAQAGQGKVVEAWENYHSIILENVTSPPVFATALADAQKEIAGVEGRRAKVTISVTGGDAPRVTIDDVPLKVEALGVPRFVDPGAHVFKAVSGDGHKTAAQSLTIAEGSTQNVSLALVNDPNAVAGGVLAPTLPGVTPPDSSQPATDSSGGSGGSWNKTVGFVALGVGGAFLIEGVITGVLAISKHSDLAKVCTNGCPPADSSELSSYQTMGTLSTVGFIVGAIGVAGGTVLLLTAPSSASASPPAPSALRVTPFIGFGSAGAVGTF